jgi:hypothetical protein
MTKHSQDQFAAEILDIRRIEVLLLNFEPPLHDPKAMRRFVGSVHTASSGDPDVLALLVTAIHEWQDVSVVELEQLWNSFEFEHPTGDALAVLKAFCMSQPIPLPQHLERAIFDTSSDFSDVYREFLTLPSSPIGGRS